MVSINAISAFVIFIERNKLCENKSSMCCPMPLPPITPELSLLIQMLIHRENIFHSLALDLASRDLLWDKSQAENIQLCVSLCDSGLRSRSPKAQAVSQVQPPADLPTERFDRLRLWINYYLPWNRCTCTQQLASSPLNSNKAKSSLYKGAASCTYLS